MAMFEIPGLSDARKVLQDASREMREKTGDKKSDPKAEDKPPAKARGGKITRVAGPKRGKEDGTIAVQRGEFVVRKAATKQYGDKKMAAVNRGTAKVTTKGKR